MVEVSVVVASRNRRPRLERLLDRLAAQREAPAFEVVVVDDGSTDGTAEVTAPAGAPFALRVLRVEGGRGPAAARNLGWRAAAAPVVAFTDDDCQPAPGWLAGLVGGGADIVQGRTDLDPAQAPNLGPWAHWTAVPEADGRYPTCNIAYRRAALEAAGGFDETTFGVRRSLGGEARCIWGEDTDLARRAIAAGATTAFVDDAVVLHDVSPGRWLDHVRDMRRMEGLAVLSARYGTPAGPFTRVTDAPVLAVVAGAAATALTRSAVAAAATVAAGGWYALACRRARHGPGRRSAWPAVLPGAFLADAYAVTVVARASVRHGARLL